MVNIDGLIYQRDYFFLVYELHYFILAWIVIYYAAMINSKWRDMSDLVAIHFSKNLMTVKIDKPEDVGPILVNWNILASAHLKYDRNYRRYSI